jgi:hypothetical protein
LSTVAQSEPPRVTRTEPLRVAQIEPVIIDVHHAVGRRGTRAGFRYVSGIPACSPRVPDIHSPMTRVRGSIILEGGSVWPTPGGSTWATADRHQRRGGGHRSGHRRAQGRRRDQHDGREGGSGRRDRHDQRGEGGGEGAVQVIPPDPRHVSSAGRRPERRDEWHFSGGAP